MSCLSAADMLGSTRRFISDVEQFNDSMFVRVKLSRVMRPWTLVTNKHSFIACLNHVMKQRNNAVPDTYHLLT